MGAARRWCRQFCRGVGVRGEWKTRVVYVQLVTYATRRRTEQAHARGREDEEEAEEVTEEELRSEMKKNPVAAALGK